MAVPQLRDDAPIVVDTSCWLEVFGDTPRAALFHQVIDHPHSLVVPVVTIYEVFKVIRRQRDEAFAKASLAYMQQGIVVDLDIRLCLDAATNGLPFADSLIYATARSRGATLWTQDAHFDGLPGVRYFAKA